jgi:fluoroquinolone transport system permease protein
MKKYLNLLKYEFKTIFKDSMNLFMIIYPFMMLGILAFLIPETIKSAGETASRVVLLISLALALVMGSYISGVLLGFSLIENKDENTILSIAVTPVSIKGYTFFKIIYAFLLSILSNIILLGGLKLFANEQYVIILGEYSIHLLDNLSWGKTLIFAIVNSFFVPTVALLLGTYSKNKIEGFAFVKGGAIFIMLPVLSLLNIFKNAKQYLLGILPNFWPIKAMMNEATMSSEQSNLNYYLYMLIGGLYFLIIFIFTFRLYLKRMKN